MATGSFSVTDLTAGVVASRPIALVGTEALKPLMTDNCRPTWPPSRSTCRAAASRAPGSARTITDTGGPSAAELAPPATAGSMAAATITATATASSPIVLPPSAPNAPAPIVLCPSCLAAAASSLPVLWIGPNLHPPHR
jgi:hypothetical protein